MKFNLTLGLILALIILSSCRNSHNTHQKTIQKQDSISTWIKQSKSRKSTHKEKLNSLKKAYNKILQLEKDSIKPSQLSTIAYRFYQLKDTFNFFKVNEQTLKLAEKNKDSFVIADAHWSYADYYLNGEIFDKAYYHFNLGYNFFNGINKKYHTARMLYSMAYIKGLYRDYSGSEVLNIQALKLFKEIDDSEYLYESYNHLAILQNDIKKFDRALNYHKKALEIAKRFKNGKKNYNKSFNNIGYTYMEKEEYDNAIKYFNKALSYNYNRETYARTIDNRAYARLKQNDTANVEKDMLKSLFIRDSLKKKSSIVFIKIRLAKYYQYIQDTLKAKNYALEAKKLAYKIQNGVDYLTSLELLSELDPGNSGRYLKEHIRYNDSLSQSERETLNKFTRIEFETDEIIEKNEILTQQRVWIFGASFGLILILSLLYFIRVQRVKNEKLFLETEQQKANEQVYLLTLKQQATLEEEKTKERNRISQELHDGILGRLFGTRVGLGFLDLNADEKTQEQHEAFLEELQDIEKEIREVSHKLNDNFASPDVNFTSIVTQLLESKSQIGDFQFHLNIDENISWKSTDEIIKVNVYRIIQETLQNTIKHAQAKNVILEFSSSDQELSVKIEDDGVGFNLKKSRKGIGLKNMKSRVEKLNGTLEITSAMNKGTQIHIKIPII